MARTALTRYKLLMQTTRAEHQSQGWVADCDLLPLDGLGRLPLRQSGRRFKSGLPDLPKPASEAGFQFESSWHETPIRNGFHAVI